MTTYEEARRCPRCSELGEHVEAEDRTLKVGPSRGSRMIKIYCRNERCKWYNTAWTVQRRPDGTIPDALLHRQKNFPELPTWGARSIETLERQLELETQAGGAELNGR